MSRETSKYSIAFAKAENKCGGVVQFYEQDTALIIGGPSNANKVYLRKIIVNNPGNGYNPDNPPEVTISGGGITNPNNQAKAIPIIEGGRITSIRITEKENGVYSTQPTVTINPGPATATAVLAGVVFKKRGDVKLQYTTEKYEGTVVFPITPFPKQTPYPNIAGTPPFYDDYYTGNDYLTLQGDTFGGSGPVGAGKKIEDLPLCEPTPLRVDIFPSIAKMGYYKPRGVISITVTDGGTGYLLTPTVILSEPTEEEKKLGYSQATAEATISGGSVTAITITNPGGYITIPTVTIERNILGEMIGNPASAEATLGLGEVNSMNFEAYVFGGDNPSQTLTWTVLSAFPDHVIDYSMVLGSVTPPGSPPPLPMQLSKAIFTPGKSETAREVIINAAMYAQTEIFGRAVVQLIPSTMVDWPSTTVKGYSPGETLIIKNWIFGGGTNQSITTELTGWADATTVFDNVRKELKVGVNETADFLTLCITPDLPGLETVCIDIYKKYVAISDDQAGNILSRHYVDVCNGTTKTKQYHARFRIDDESDYKDYNYTNDLVTTLALWSITGNVLTETKIDPNTGLLTIGGDSTPYQYGNPLLSGRQWYTPGGGKITKVIITNGGSGYDAATTATITNSKGQTTAVLQLTIVSGVITGVSVSNGGTDYNPLDTIIISNGGGGSGFTYNLQIDNHLEVSNTPTVFMILCETGEIVVSARYDNIVGRTLPI